MRYRHLVGGLLYGLTALQTVQADSLTVKLELPVINTAQYHAPFVAIWLEQAGQRRAVKTLSLWYDDAKWLKDIRRWWRKAGRYTEDFDAISSASRVAGHYELHWALTDTAGQPLPAGEYTLLLEAVREHGNRTLLKQPITLGTAGAQHFELAGGTEIGQVTIHIQPEE